MKRRSGKTRLIRRQIRMTVLLTLLCVFCVAAGLYLREINSYVQVEQPAYATEKDIARALEAYRQMPEGEGAAARERAPEACSVKAELVFTGVTSPDMMLQIAQTLEEYGNGATFYLSMVEANGYEESILSLLEHGCRAGILGDGSGGGLSGADGEALTAELCRAATLIHARYGVSVASALSASQPDAQALAAAAANGIGEIVVPSAFLELGDCTSVEEARRLLETIPRQGILHVQIARQAGDQAACLCHLLTALESTDMEARAGELLDAADFTQLEEPMKRIYTTQRAACFTFSGLGNSRELTGVLDALEAMEGKALFYVTLEETRRYGTDLQRILDAGHDLGICVETERFPDETKMLEQMLLIEEALRQEYGYTGELPVRAARTGATEAMLRAASAGGYPVLSSLLSPVREEDVLKTDAQSILETILPADGRTLQRGEIVHFMMNQYRLDDALLGELVGLVGRERSVYPLCSVMDVMRNEAYCYTYPVPEDAVLPAVRDKIYPGQLTQDSMELIRTRYIGAPWVDRASYLPGFTNAEIRQIDKRGYIDNDSNMVFLSFDDWGTDKTITQLLDVLDKHQAKATFFVRTEYVSNNPNLLRAIAEAGHAVASHTHRHVPLSNASTEKKNTYLTLTGEQVAALREDLVLSYQTLQSIIGDVQVHGVPALTRYFRPPTLAVSRVGIETVFDCGFTWSISGSFSSQDYIATDAQSLQRSMERNTRSGAVLVMHMSDNSIYTAQALDGYLTQMEQSGKAYRFVTMTEALDPVSAAGDGP